MVAYRVIKIVKVLTNPAQNRTVAFTTLDEARL